MSYILDALKKAEKERKRGTVPNLSTDQDPILQKPKKRPLWPYILIVALLINAGFFFLWLSLREPQKTIIVAKSPAVVTSDIHEKEASKESSDIQSHSARESSGPKKIAPSVIESSQEKISHELQTTIPEQKPAETPQQRQPVQTNTIHEDDIQDESPQGIESEEPADAPPPSTTSGTLSTEPIAPDEEVSSSHPPSESRFILYDLKSLPSSVKEDLPDINISVFVYSDDPSSRVVKINGQTVREGQELADGLMVEKIVPEGVIFTYEDYRFRVGVR